MKADRVNERQSLKAEMDTMKKRVKGKGGTDEVANEEDVEGKQETGEEEENEEEEEDEAGG